MEQAKKYKTERTEVGRRPPFTVQRRDRCVQRIIKETGIDQWQAEIAYRISTANLTGNRSVKEDGK